MKKMPGNCRFSSTGAGSTAKIEQESGPDKGEIGVSQPVEIKGGMHFLVTRRVVEGGRGE